MLRRLLLAVALVSGMGHLSSAVTQEDWPKKPVRIIVSLAAGSGGDVTGRVFADRLSKTFGQPFVLDFRPGANGIVGTEAAAKSPNDGYTLLYTFAAAHVVNPSLYPKLSYDPIKDFAPIAQVGGSGNLLLVPASSPVNNLQEFIAFVKSKPADELSYGSWGTGSGGHLSMEALKHQTKTQIKHIPYKSSAQVLTDLMGGVLDSAFAAVPAALPLVQAGKLKAIAMSGPRRTPQLPDVKTMTEQGVPFEQASFYAFIAPAGTPKLVIDRLNKEINKIMTDPESRSQLEGMGLGYMPTKTPEEFDETIKADLKAWAVIIREANVKPE